MSASSVLPYFRARCRGMKFEEHKEAFDFADIGETKLAKCFHLTLGDFTSVSVNHTLIEMRAPVEVRLFYNGTRDAASVRDQAVADSEKLIQACMKAVNRVGSGLKLILSDGFKVDRHGTSNDRAVISTLKFMASVLIDAEGA